MSQSAYLSNYEPTQSYASLSYFDFEQHAKEWQDVISTHPFNHKLSIVLPFCDTDTARKHLNEVAGCYYQLNLPLASILDPDFLANVVRSDTHQFLLHSIDTHLDSDNVVTIDHNGKLVFSLLKSAYESFGIVAEHGQNKQDKLRQKYIVTIDLRDRKLVPNTKKYDRLKTCIESTFPKPFKMIATLVDKGITAIHTSGISFERANWNDNPIDNPFYLVVASGESVEIVWPTSVSNGAQKRSMDITVESLNYISIPTFNDLRPTSLSAKPDAMWQHNTLKALEWIGLANIKANRITANDKPESFVSVYNPPSSISTGSGTLVTWTGLIHPLFISHILVTIKKLLLSKKEMQWVSLSTWGYRDSIYTWESQQHYYFTNGENDYTFLLLSPHEQQEGRIATIGYQMYGSDHIQK
ncbi:ribonuclease P 40kDa subunit-domain-containing protein [Zychaea mexicana]|uniref:ribonuclease P 40kDa subunit-domain-containing protein n=1 Tax=Zychaea mexicana TaxID=64656 RepID=UPI0022FDFD83|nr:ribonuclease P 40kDa subunit-domain-containing protein [Zychaea mexicana]KAI9496130.1 ribonuclease P 40kDa subunit-domain-containing protein [Zychaea mexicana]